MPGKHSGFKMYGKSPMMKKLIGNQDKLPVELQEEIKRSPGRKYAKKASMAKDYKKGYYGA